jgi:uncharacterized membrane protein
MKLIRLAIIAGLVLTFLITIIAYPYIPDQVVSHWNAAGQPDGSMTKFWGLMLIPLIMTALVALFAVIPRIDPLRKSYETFRNYYEGFVLLLVLFLLAVQLMVISWNIGYQVSPNLLLPVLIGILFIYIGFLLDHAEQNWFVGIRTPWTLSSRTVWKKTHELGGKLFKISGIVCFAGLFFPDLAVWFILVPTLTTAVVTVVYSYYVYTREEVHDKQGGTGEPD